MQSTGHTSVKEQKVMRIIIDGETPDKAHATCDVWAVKDTTSFVKTHHAIDKTGYEVNPDGTLGKRVN